MKDCQLTKEEIVLGGPIISENEEVLRGKGCSVLIPSGSRGKGTYAELKFPICLLSKVVIKVFRAHHGCYPTYLPIANESLNRALAVPL